LKAPRWIAFVSVRWFSARRESGGGASSLLAASGIAIGVAALVVVLGVMNGFQLGFIDSILEVSSFHVRVEGDGSELLFSKSSTEAVAEGLAALPGAASVLPFAEARCLAETQDGRSFPLAVRAMPDEAPREDPSLMKALGLVGGPGAWPGKGGIFLGAEIARYLGVGAGDEIGILSVSSSEEEGIEAQTAKVRVAGLFRSGYYDFDFGMAVLPFSAASAVFTRGTPPPITYGVKLRDRYADAAFVSKAEVELGIAPARIESWRDFNRAFFGALRTEKTVMMLLVGLIFLVVGVNIFHAMRRAVAEKTEDIAVLKAMGASSRDIGLVFSVDGLAIGAGGALVGLAVGLLVAVNVNEVFRLAEALVNSVAALAARIAGGFGGDSFRVFSPQYFYLVEVPVRVLFPETFFVVAAAIASSMTAAVAAAGRLARLAPAEVLRYE
jgi:lipoprotein-releasing system permease protein